MASSGAGRCNARKQTRRPFFELSVLGAASREATEAFKHFALCFVFGRFCCIFVNQHVYDHCLEAQGWVCEQARLMHPRLRPIKPAKNAHDLVHQSAHNSFNMSEFIQCVSFFFQPCPRQLEGYWLHCRHPAKTFRNFTGGAQDPARTSPSGVRSRRLELEAGVWGFVMPPFDDARIGMGSPSVI